jgi:hypothetical protein
VTRSKPIHDGPRRYILDPTWPALLAHAVPPEFEPAGPVEVWELPQHGHEEVRAERWPFPVDAVCVLASVPLHAFRHGGQWPYSGDLKPRTAAIYLLAERDLLTVTVRQGRAGQVAVLPLLRASITGPGE